MAISPVAVLTRPSRCVQARASGFVAAKGLAPLRAARPARIAGRSSLVVSAGEEVDFDAILARGAEAWDKSDKKVAVVGYSIATLVGLYVIESIAHLPVLNVLIGVPLELLGIFSAGALGYRYLKENQDPFADISDFTGKVTKDLPGFK